MEDQYYYLRIPIDLDCYPVYEETRNDTYTFAGQLADFSMLPHRGSPDEEQCIAPRLSPYISEDLVSKPFESTSVPLREGIHVHWALPKALRTAIFTDMEDEKATVHYRPVPNRWMIRRKVFKNGSEIKTYKKTFILESDLLSKNNPGNSNAFPYKPENFQKGDLLFRYLGKLWPYEKEDDISAFKKEEEEKLYLKDLNALGYGDPLFSAYYPECRNVFGFHDSFADIDLAKEEGLMASYQVIGWYSDPEKDPFFNGSINIKESDPSEFNADNIEETIAARNKQYFLEDGTGASFDWDIVFEQAAFDPDNIDPYDERIFGRSLYCGVIKKIPVNPTEPEKYKTKSDNQTAMTQTRISIGNTPGQALAALLANTTEGADVQSMELMLDALQLGLLSQSDQADLIAKIDNGMHQASFTPEAGGHTWQIRTKKPEPVSGQKETPPLKSMTQEDLSYWNKRLTDLNKMQQESDDIQFKINDEQIQLYADWYKYMITEYNLRLGPITRENRVNDIRHYLGKQMEHLTAQFFRLEQLEMDIELQVEELNNGFESWNNKVDTPRWQYKLLKKPAARFWKPAEPAILFHGDNIKHSPRYNKEEPTSGTILLLEEFLSDRNPSATEQVRNIFDNDALLNKLFDFTSEEHDFSGISWGPLFLDWQVRITPVTKPYDKHGNQQPWSTASVIEKFDLSSGEIDLHRTNIEKQPDGEEVQIFDGRSILTSGAHKSLIQAVEDGLKSINGEIEKEEDRKLIKSLKDKEVLSQNLSGLNDAFAMHKQILQLDVFDPLADNLVLDNFTNNLLKKMIGNGNKVSPLPSNLFMPIRDGWMRVSKLRLVDCFGQYSQWEHKDRVQDSKGSSNSKQAYPDVIIAESLKPSGDEHPDKRRFAAYLPPRLVQPARINFSLLSANDDELTENHTEFNPVCGWILPNFLDESLYVYDEAGKAIGVLQLQTQRGGEQIINWVKPPGETTFESIENPLLKNWVDFFQSQDGSYLEEFNRLCFESLQNIDPENFASFTGINMLMGRPLAIVKASIGMELKGVPMKNQSWKSRLKAYAGDDYGQTMNFESVQFPIHLGDVSQSNDGLVGFYAKYDEDPCFEEFYCSFSENEFGPKGMPEIVQQFIKDEMAKISNAIELAILDLKSRHDEDRLALLKQKGSYSDEKKLAEIADMNAAKRKIKEFEDILNPFKKESLNQLKEAEEASGKLFYKKPKKDYFNISCSSSDKFEVVMVIDPRGKVHLTSGILPVKSIQLDQNAIAEALSRIETAFLTTPILTPGNPLLIPTINDAEMSWSWLEQNKPNNWEEIPPGKIKQPSEQFVPFVDKLKLKEGWLKINSKNTKDQ